MESDKNKLEKELKELLGFRSTLDDFQRADVVLFCGSQFATGVEYRDNRPHVIAKTNGFGTRLVNDQSYKLGIPRLNREAELNRNIYLQHEVGEELSDELMTRLAQGYRIHRFLPYDPTDDPQMICFHDLADQKLKLGFYESHDEDQLYFRAFDKKSKAVKRSNIVPGTARRGHPDDIFEEVDDVDFLDFSALQIAKHLGSPVGFPTHVNLGVEMDIDLPERLLNNNLQFRGQLTFFDIFTIGAIGVIPQPRKEFLESISLELEDLFISKLNKLGVPVVEREEMALVINGYREAEIEYTWYPRYNLSVSVTEKEVRSMGKASYASHVALVEVGECDTPNHYRLSIRLLNANSSNVVWADVAERPYFKAVPAKYQSLKSGQLFILNDPEKVRKLLARDFPNLKKKPAQQFQPRLMYYENEFADKSDPKFLNGFRDLDNPSFTTISRKDIHSKSSYAVEEWDEDKPTQMALDYICWGLCDSIAPSAGRVVSSNETTTEIRLKGAGRFVNPGDRLRVVRFAGEKRTSAPDIVPAILTISKVNEDSIEASANLTALKPVWNAENKPQKGDVVYPLNMQRPLIAIENAILIIPPIKQLEQQGLARGPKGKEVRSTAIRMGKVAAKRLRQQCMDSNIAIVVGEDEEAVIDKGATHVIKTTIEPVTKSKFKMNFTIFKSGIDQPISQTEVIVREKDLMFR